ncbi:Tad domain-containing protein [Sphingomonas mesophila]|uniref:Tad domain-containing protein n=1 Tax=Sphingomonas mesophila TaxID=2303576 RepID=UPI000E589062|nr:Tad domain-containing protein [Sphingomonas mesophila]
MRNIFREIWEDKRGNSLILAAAALPLLLGSAGLATDTIQWALWKRQLQRAADSAAIAGVYDRSANDGATANTEAAVDHDLTLNNPLDTTKFPLTQKTVTFPSNSGNQQNQVRVVLAVQRPLSFSSMFMTNPPVIQTSAQAAAVSTEGEFCVLSLQKNGKTGIQATGSASITMDCGMMTNSISTNAAAGQGSAVITATTLAAAGGIQQSSQWQVTSYQPYSPALEDPYASLTPDTDDTATCPNNPPSLTVNNGNSGLVVNGGACYSSISVNSNRVLTLQNGVYFIHGGGVNVQGTLNLINATIVLSNKDLSSSSVTVGSFDANSNGQINATAPTTGKWAGIAIYQDRRATDNAPTGNITASSPNRINGNSTNKIRGVVYFPNQQLTYNGNGTGTATCTQFVAKRIYWSGSSGINNFTKNCNMHGMSPITAPLKVRLVA